MTAEEQLGMQDFLGGKHNIKARSNQISQTSAAFPRKCISKITLKIGQHQVKI